MSGANHRYSNGNARRKLRKRIASLGLPCAICGKPIDYTLPSLHPMSYELDERVPVSLGGSPIDPDNVQPAHRICNERKGADFSGSKSKSSKRPRGALPQSRDW